MDVPDPRCWAACCLQGFDLSLLVTAHHLASVFARDRLTDFCMELAESVELHRANHLLVFHSRAQQAARHFLRVFVSP